MIAGVAFDAALADPFSYRVPDGWQLAPGQRVLAQLRGALSFKKAERKTYVPSNQPKVLPVVSEKQSPNLPGAQRNKNIIQETRHLESPSPIPLPNGRHHCGRLQPVIEGGGDDATRAFHRMDELPQQARCAAILSVHGQLIGYDG